MSMCALGMAEEYKGRVAFNCLWPRTAIATAAVQMVVGDLGMKARRRAPISGGRSRVRNHCESPSRGLNSGEPHKECVVVCT